MRLSSEITDLTHLHGWAAFHAVAREFPCIFRAQSKLTTQQSAGRHYTITSGTLFSVTQDEEGGPEPSSRQCADLRSHEAR